MKVVILAGGLGTRIGEETSVKPKPMIEIGGKPILWHIMKIYSAHNIHDFIICLGYKGYVIKEYFANYCLHVSDFTIDMTKNKMEIHHVDAEPWRVTLVDTGDTSNTGGRIKRVQAYIGHEDFCMTYGDGVGDVNVTALIAFHKEHKDLCTVTVVQPPGRFGSITLDQRKVTGFEEKPQGDGGWVNGGFFVLSPEALDYIDGDETIWERDSMARLAQGGGLSAFQHSGFWQPMDTLRDRNYLEELWQSGKAPWKIWK